MSLNDPITIKIGDLGSCCLSLGQVSSAPIDNPRWKSPELLCNSPYTKKCDVYSFGIIMSELVRRSIPFSELKWDSQVISNILQGVRPVLPLDCEENYKELLENCWHKEPSSRPSFKKIFSFLSKFFPNF